ncbi:pre-mRNA 3'-end-processing factor FIP1 isoform X2 [Salminus brasiliensis]|uniref:pre-mRNA 3'-end-processing factor FIP1 isoform X2 n=1 Tax=Salminus brasiliensis TaxID=930266 RepID=UPI003B83252C
MSTEGTGRAGCASGDDEEWLYGENDEEENPNPDAADDDEKTETEVFSALVGDVEGVNGTASQDGDAESDSDSDDDDEVCVTIGNIKRDSGQSTSTPVSFNIKASSRSTLTGTKARGVNLEVLGGGVSGTRMLEEDEESFEEKPWRKPGADLSDYFNYGFSEDTWKAYCDKQRRMRMSLEVMTLGSSSKTMVNRGDFSSISDCSSRKSNTSINVVRGQAGTISRVEGRRRPDENDTQVQPSSEQSSDAEFQSTKLHPFLPLNIPPPPFPPFPISATPPLIPPPPRLPIRVPPPGFPVPPGVPSPPSIITTLDSSHKGGSYDGPSAPSYPFSAGVFPPVLGGVASWPDLMDNVKAWEYYTRHDKKREREREKERTRERERERERNRDRQRDREHTPSIHGRSSDEESVMRHRDHSDRERERERHRARSSRAEEREDRYRERRHRDRNERHKSSRSYSRRRHASDDGESHRRHRHKRSRHNKESTEPSEEHSAEHENHSEATE